MALTMTSIHDLLEAGAAALGYELLTVELAGGDVAVLRVFIDSPQGINVEDCAKASRQFSAILDVEDPISSRYTLEVSSPGLDRPLAKVEHFARVVGQKIKVRMSSSDNGRRRYTGILRSIEEDVVTIEVDGELFELSIQEMDKARLVPDFDKLPSVDN